MHRRETSARTRRGATAIGASSTVALLLFSASAVGAQTPDAVFQAGGDASLLQFGALVIPGMGELVDVGVAETITFGTHDSAASSSRNVDTNLAGNDAVDAVLVLESTVQPDVVEGQFLGVPLQSFGGVGAGEGTILHANAYDPTAPCPPDGGEDYTRSIAQVESLVLGPDAVPGEGDDGEEEEGGEEEGGEEEGGGLTGTPLDDLLDMLPDGLDLEGLIEQIEDTPLGDVLEQIDENTPLEMITDQVPDDTPLQPLIDLIASGEDGDGEEEDPEEGGEESPLPDIIPTRSGESSKRSNDGAQQFQDPGDEDDGEDTGDTVTDGDIGGALDDLLDPVNDGIGELADQLDPLTSGLDDLVDMIFDALGLPVPGGALLEISKEDGSGVGSTSAVRLVPGASANRAGIVVDSVADTLNVEALGGLLDIEILRPAGLTVTALGTPGSASIDYQAPVARISVAGQEVVTLDASEQAQTFEIPMLAEITIGELVTSEIGEDGRSVLAEAATLRLELFDPLTVAIGLNEDEAPPAVDLTLGPVSAVIADITAGGLPCDIGTFQAPDPTAPPTSNPTTSPTSNPTSTPQLPVTGGGSALFALAAMGSALGLSSRRRRD